MSAPRLTACRDCGAEISRRADNCPRCGAQTPTGRLAHAPGALAAGVIAVAVFWTAWTWDSGGRAPAPAPPDVPDAQCRASLGCWARRHELAAQIACRPRIEAHAKYQARWTDGTVTFAYTEMSQRTPGALVYLGDGVQMQNGFGAWQHYTYACTYNPDRRAVTALEVLPGRI